MAQGDLDLNSVQRYTDSLTVMLKQTMLDQEITFRNQVHELHRLYRTQRTFMVDLGWKEIETCDFWDESSQLTAIPVANPTRYDQIAVETAHSSISTVGSAQILRQDFYKLQQRPLEFHHQAAPFLSRGNVWNHSPEAMKLKYSLNGGDFSDSDDLKLSLSIGDKKRRKRGIREKWLHKKTPPYPHEIIDLEQDYKTNPDEIIDLEQDYKTNPDEIIDLEQDYKNKSQVSALSNQIITRSAKKDQSHSTSFKVGLLDLNEVYVDNSSCYSNDPMIQMTHNPQNPGAASNLDRVYEDFATHKSDGKMENVEPRAEDAVDSHSCQSQDSVQDQQISISDKLSGNHIGSEVAEEKHRGDKNKGESAEVDILIQSAAESLVNISLTSSTYVHESSTKEGSNEVENEKKELPCDSYEAITLNLEESNADEYYSVSSNPCEVFDSEIMKDFGLKLRRGRRLKDFQKEILPSLASLARHEISEDINIMEGVLRSREYRRLRGKMADGEGLSSPLTRRRSTGKRGGRRNRK